MVNHAAADDVGRPARVRSSSRVPSQFGEARYVLARARAGAVCSATNAVNLNLKGLKLLGYSTTRDVRTEGGGSHF